MRLVIPLPLLVLLAACQPQKSSNTAAIAATASQAITPAAVIVPKADLITSVVRVNATQQSWSAGQPWEKNSPKQRSALAAIVGPRQVLTTSELVADSTFLELESTDGKTIAQAKIIAVDYEANIALLGPISDEEGQRLFEKTTVLGLGTSSKIGQAMGILQVEDNGQSLLTPGNLQSIDISSSFIPGQSFLTYRVKASMQSGTSSDSLPVILDDKLAGVLISYNSKDQLCDIAPAEMISRFLKEAADGNYQGFPSLGISTSRTEDPSFRQWLKLSEDQGGIYISKVRHKGPAELAGIKRGDILLAVDGKPIDRRGYYQHPVYGSLFWGHLIRGEKFTGDSVSLSLLRDGQPTEVKATLTREDESKRLVPSYTFGTAPNYLVKGGFVFQELSRPLLESFGEEWTSRAPLNFIDALENPEKYEGKVERIVFLSGSIPTPATVGYESLRNLIVKKVNGREITNMKTLIEAFKGNLKELHSIEFAEEDFTVYLDDAISNSVDAQLLKRGIPKLSHVE
jgi:S1-C subfamily serine protease